MSSRFAGAEWLKAQAPCWKIPEPSEFGCLIADILGDTFAGLYHLESRQLRNVLWSAPSHISVKLRRGTDLATWDSNHLTLLVIYCHDAAVRMSVDAATISMLSLTFSRRISGNTSIMRGHWTMEEAIERARSVRPVEARIEATTTA